MCGAEGRDVSGREERNRRLGDTTYSARRDDEQQIAGSSLDNVDYWVRRQNGGYKYMNIELYDRGRRRRTIEVDDVGNLRLTVYARISFNSQR